MKCAAHGGGVRCTVTGCKKAAVGRQQLCRLHSGTSVPRKRQAQANAIEVLGHAATPNLRGHANALDSALNSIVGTAGTAPFFDERPAALGLAAKQPQEDHGSYIQTWHSA